MAFDGNLYSVPARRIRHRQLVKVRPTAETITIHATNADAYRYAARTRLPGAA